MVRFVVLSWVLLSAFPVYAQSQLLARMEVPPHVEPTNIPLVHERVAVTIDRQHATTTLQQTYHNRVGADLEGRFYLRTSPGGKMEGFSYWNGEQRIVGEVLEREAARRVYESVTSVRRDPGLVEEVGEASFSFRVFPIAPNEEKRVEVRFTQWLTRRSGWIEYRSPVGGRNANVEIALVDPRGIAEVESPSHHIQLEELGGGRVRVRSRRTKSDFHSEIVIHYRLHDGPWELAATTHRDAGHAGFFVASLATPMGVGSEVAPKDITLVIDVSGSMEGEPIARAREAALDVVARLKPEDRINVIAFDDSADGLFSQPRRLEGQARAAALDFIHGLRSGGGTDIAAALSYALSRQDPQSGRSATVLMITDGQSDSANALGVARSADDRTRVFTIGVGGGVDRHLLSRLASEKGGRFTFIESASALRTRTDNLFRQIEAPVLISPTLELEGGNASRLYPDPIPDLFLHDEIRVVGRFRGHGRATFVLRGVLNGERVEMRAPVSLERSRRPWVGRLWAQERVGHLLEEIALQGRQHELVNEVIELALAYRFVTPYTSFLAIPESELTEGAADNLRIARERVAQALQNNADAQALNATASASTEDDDVMASSAPRQESWDDSAGDESDGDYEASPEMSIDMEPSRAGCASCSTSGGDVPPTTLVLILLALSKRRHRQRKRQLRCGFVPPGDAKSSSASLVVRAMRTPALDGAATEIRRRRAHPSGRRYSCRTW